MKYVVFEDERGWKHRALLRDKDPESMAAMGVIEDPPLISDLNWDELKRLIHNNLVEGGVFTWADVQAQQNGVTRAITSAVRKQLITYYRSIAKEKKNANHSGGV